MPLELDSVPQALLTEQFRQLERLRLEHGDDAIALAEGYVRTFSISELEGTALEMSQDFDWGSDLTLEVLAEFLKHAATGGEATPKGVHSEVLAMRAITGIDYGEVQTKTVGSAVLVSDEVILTAHHVDTAHDPDLVYFREASGDDHIEIRDRVGLGRPADIAAVVLRDPAPVEARRVPVAEDSEYDYRSKFRSVGYGSRVGREAGSKTIKNHIDALLVSLRCEEPQAIGDFACQEGMELVAGEPHKTACVNDSGGALEVRVGDEWKLVGIVTRGIRAGCDSAVRYARVAAYREQLNQALQAKGLPTF